MSKQTYFDNIWIISRVFWDKCYYTLFKHFDLFEPVERIYPDNVYYSWWHLLHPPNQVIHNLYIGSAFNAADKTWLKENEIDIVVNATESISNFFPDEFTYYRFAAEDLEKGSLSEHYHNFVKCIRAHPDKNILVHCYAGRSRSAALLLYYLVREKEMNLTAALELLKEKRPLININQKFVQEIREMEEVFSTT